MTQFFTSQKMNYAALFHDDDNGLMRAFIRLSNGGSTTIVKNYLSSALTMPENLHMVMNQLWESYKIPFNNITTKLAALTLAKPSQSDFLQPHSVQPSSWAVSSAAA